MDPFKQRRMRLTTVQWASVGQCINWETRFTAKEISGLSINSSGLKPPPWTRVFTSLKLATFMTCLNGQEVQQVNPLLVERLGVGLDWSGSYKSQAQTPTSSKRKIYKIRGTHLFTITGYSLDNDTPQETYIESSVFSAGGHDWSIKYYPNGSDEAAQNFISISVCLKSMESAKALPLLGIRDKNNMPTALFNNNDRVHKFNFNEEYGFSNFATRQDLEQHLMEDTFIIRCNLEVRSEGT